MTALPGNTPPQNNPMIVIAPEQYAALVEYVDSTPKMGAPMLMQQANSERLRSNPHLPYASNLPDLNSPMAEAVIEALKGEGAIDIFTQQVIPSATGPLTARIGETLPAEIELKEDNIVSKGISKILGRRAAQNAKNYGNMQRERLNSVGVVHSAPNVKMNAARLQVRSAATRRNNEVDSYNQKLQYWENNRVWDTATLPDGTFTATPRDPEAYMASQRHLATIEENSRKAKTEDQEAWSADLREEQDQASEITRRKAERQRDIELKADEQDLKARTTKLRSSELDLREKELEQRKRMLEIREQALQSGELGFLQTVDETERDDDYAEQMQDYLERKARWDANSVKIDTFKQDPAYAELFNNNKITDLDSAIQKDVAPRFDAQLRAYLQDANETLPEDKKWKSVDDMTQSEREFATNKLVPTAIRSGITRKVDNEHTKAYLGTNANNHDLMLAVSWYRRRFTNRQVEPTPPQKSN